MIKLFVVGISLESVLYPERNSSIYYTNSKFNCCSWNHEKYLPEGMPTEYPNEENMGLEEMQHHKWEHNLLSRKSIDFLKAYPIR